MKIKFYFKSISSRNRYGLTLTCWTFVSKYEDCREIPVEVHVYVHEVYIFGIYISLVWSDMNKV